MIPCVDKLERGGTRRQDPIFFMELDTTRSIVTLSSRRAPVDEDIIINPVKSSEF